MQGLLTRVLPCAPLKSLKVGILKETKDMWVVGLTYKKLFHSIIFTRTKEILIFNDGGYIK
jgi:hypothetical protein